MASVKRTDGQRKKSSREKSNKWHEARLKGCVSGMQRVGHLGSEKGVELLAVRFLAGPKDDAPKPISCADPTAAGGL